MNEAQLEHIPWSKTSTVKFELLVDLFSNIWNCEKQLGSANGKLIVTCTVPITFSSIRYNYSPISHWWSLSGKYLIRPFFVKLKIQQATTKNRAIDIYSMDSFGLFDFIWFLFWFHFILFCVYDITHAHSTAFTHICPYRPSTTFIQCRYIFIWSHICRFCAW